MGMKILKKHPSFSLIFSRTTCCFRSRSRSVMVREKKEKRVFYFETIFITFGNMYLCMCTVFFFFFSLNEIWRARQGCPMETPQDDKRFFFFCCNVPSSLYHTLWTKKQRNLFVCFSSFHVRTKQYPPILRFAFIPIYIIICIFE